jgi:hypothetical protein
VSGCGRRVVGLAVALALVAGGCGSASSSSSSSSSKSATRAGVGAAGTSSGGTSANPAAAVIPPGAVAVAAGVPITQASLNHWMGVAAKSQAGQAPGQAAIVPTDPPGFAHCIAVVRKQIPSLKKSTAKALRADCAQLYRALSTETMDFLIKADWIQADAARLGVTPTQAQVDHTMNAAKDKQFPNGKGFQAFLTTTGESLQDVRFRFRINVTEDRLLAREKGSAAAKQKAVDTREKQLFLPETRCAAAVAMADCENYRAG